VTATEERPAAEPGGVDAFRVLGLPYSPDLTDAEVHAAYLLRLRAAHPDNGGDAGAAAAVTAAYDALRSGVRRGDLLTAVTVDRESTPAPPRRAWRWERAASAPRETSTEGRASARPDPVRLAELRRKVAASRAEQGLPPFITDEATLDKIVDLLVVMQGRGTTGKHYPRPAGADTRQRAGGPPVFEPSAWRRESRRQYAAERERAGAGVRVPVAEPWLVRGWLRVRYGRPGWLAARVLLAALAVVIAQVAAPGDPAVWALGVGAVTWLVRTARWDLAPRARR
jgi:hypothetical protein